MTMIHLSAHTVRIQTRSPNKKMLLHKRTRGTPTIPMAFWSRNWNEQFPLSTQSHNKLTSSKSKKKSLATTQFSHKTARTTQRTQTTCHIWHWQSPSQISVHHSVNQTTQHTIAQCLLRTNWEERIFKNSNNNTRPRSSTQSQSLRNNQDLYKVPLFNLEIAQNSQSTEKTTTQHSTTTTDVHKAPAVRTQIRWQNMMSSPTLNILFTTTIHHVCDRRTSKTDLKHCNCQPDHTTTRHQATKRKCRNTTTPHHRDNRHWDVSIICLPTHTVSA